MTTSVKTISNTMRGAPVLNGTAGALIAVLDAFLINGWGSVAPLSVSVSGGIATATFGSGQSFEQNAVVLIAGATPGTLNGEARVLTADSTTATWATSAVDGAATGAITIKYAPQSSWVKAFSGTNKAVYRSTAVGSSGTYYRVDDSEAAYATLRGYANMTNVDSGTDPFPTTAQQASGVFQLKAYSNMSNPASYRMFSDEFFVMYRIQAGSTSNASLKAACLRGFGDPITQAPGGDPWAAILSGVGVSATSPTQTGSLETLGVSSSTGGTYCPRAFSAIGSAVDMTIGCYGAGNTSASSGVTDIWGRLPSPVDGKVRTSRSYIKESATGSPIRAEIPGVLFIPQSDAEYVFTEGDIMAGDGVLAGRNLLFLTGGSNYASRTLNTYYFVDVTGPWR